ncbi:MAG TPA: nuclear transport factor 2 family protein, partial [Miltoncostaeaceae bacterium]|nr:nuclear transport factor 2 family protein [Miltoncostaeaceae bacterium]
EVRMTSSIVVPTTANEAVWHASGAALYRGDIDTFLGYWQPDGRYEVAYPVGDFPAAVQGRDALRALFAGFGAAVTAIAVHDVRFHQTDDPDVAFVEERMVADLVDGGRYENRLAIRVTFREGRIGEMLEYYGETAHERMLRRLALLAG